MSRKLYLKKNVLKVLANGTSPYYCQTCPCQQPIPTGHFFADYIEYNQHNYVNTFAPQWKVLNGTWDTDDQILQTNQIEYVNSVIGSWTPSAICTPQSRFYNSYVSITNNYGVRYVLTYTTKQLTQTDNKYILNVPLYKEDKWWNGQYGNSNESNGQATIVSGNATSAVIDNYNLNTLTTQIEFGKSKSSGIISTLIVNNVDNSFRVGDLMTVSSLYNYSITSEDNMAFPVIPTEEVDQNYIPLDNKVEAAVQYYLVRTYEGDQEGYIFSPITPTSWKTGISYKILRDNMLAGRDNVPVANKTYYFYNYGNINGSDWGYWRQIRKVGTKYYGYDTDDNRTIIQYPTTAIVSAKLSASDGRETAPAGEKIDYGIWIYDQDGYEEYPIQFTNSDSQLSYDYRLTNWFNYPDQQPDGVMIDGYPRHQYFITSYGIDNGEEEQIPDTEDYIEWWYQVNFVQDYNSATSTATMDMFRLGYINGQSQSAIISDPILTSMVLTARVEDWQQGEWDDQYVEPPVHWDANNEQFFYYEGGESPAEGEVHPNFINLAFDLPAYDNVGNLTGTQRYYVYTAPQYGVLGNRGNSFMWDDFIASGNSFDTVKVWTEINKSNYQQPNKEMTINTGYYTYKGYPGIETFYPISSNANYWFVMSGDGYGNTTQIPLTGGDSRNPQKCTAVDDPNRPPYWYFNSNFDGSQTSRKWGYFSDIFSGKYVYYPTNVDTPSVYNGTYQIGIVTPIYYDTFYGNVIKADYNQPVQFSYDSIYQKCKEMVNDYCYSFASPFVKYIATQYNYEAVDEHNNVVDIDLSTLLTDQYIQKFYTYDDDTGDIIDVTENIFVAEQKALYQNNNKNQIATWGGNPKSSNDYSIKTQKFVKMTQQEINNIVWTGENWKVDSAYAGNYLAAMKGLYCQILTGFWLRSYNDTGSNMKNATGIRKNGYFYQTLDFDTEYQFGYDLSNIQLLNDLLSADSSTCLTCNSNGNLTTTTVSAYWASISAKVQPTTKISQTNMGDYWSGCQIRVISGVFQF